MATKDPATLENPFEGWVTIKEAGEIINRHHSTVRYWANNGHVTSYPIGTNGLRVVNVEEVREYSRKNSYRHPQSRRKPQSDDSN